MKLFPLIMLAGALAAGQAGAECVYPKAPSNIPDGNTATEQEMIDGMNAIKEYNGNVTAYLNCLEMEMKARVDAVGEDAPESQVAQIKAIHAKRHDAAVEELEAHAARFNEQVRVYKARSKS